MTLLHSQNSMKSHEPLLCPKGSFGTDQEISYRRHSHFWIKNVDMEDTDIDKKESREFSRTCRKKFFELKMHMSLLFHAKTTSKLN